MVFEFWFSQTKFGESSRGSRFFVRIWHDGMPRLNWFWLKSFNTAAFFSYNTKTNQKIMLVIFKDSLQSMILGILLLSMTMWNLQKFAAYVYGIDTPIVRYHCWPAKSGRGVRQLAPLPPPPCSPPLHTHIMYMWRCQIEKCTSMISVNVWMLIKNSN